MKLSNHPKLKPYLSSSKTRLNELGTNYPKNKKNGQNHGTCSTLVNMVRIDLAAISQLFHPMTMGS